ncbi:MAG: methylmalonyl Co-A mutase-associated GTPase MeaB, partial [Propionibacteriaceae bacterium]|nr:methylmalonyl Co-A mutase-associated GTPase MeaB [Propionibacteriaceae bacterium]
MTDEESGVSTVEELVAGVLAGNRRQIARAITLVESSLMADRPRAHELLMTLRESHDAREPAVRVGVTGVPGAGKSTFIDALGVK